MYNNYTQYSVEVINIAKITIREMRERKRVTQAELAKVLGITPGAVSLWECGRREPDIDCLKAMARYFGCTVDDLIKSD